MNSTFTPAARGLKPLFALGLILLFAFALGGCKKSSPGAAADPKAFQSAPAEVKAQWDEALAAIQTNGLAAGYIQLRYLRSDPGVTPEQKQAIDAQCKMINQRLSDAAQKGDADARQALQDIRTASRVRPR